MGIMEGKMGGVREGSNEDWQRRDGWGEMGADTRRCWEEGGVGMREACVVHTETTNLHYTLPLPCFPGWLYVCVKLQPTATSVYKKQPHTDIIHTDKDL